MWEPIFLEALNQRIHDKLAHHRLDRTELAIRSGLGAELLDQILNGDRKFSIAELDCIAYVIDTTGIELMKTTAATAFPSMNPEVIFFSKPGQCSPESMYPSLTFLPGPARPNPDH
ncbi:hypothetical protein ACL02S_22785 [Nocardia sp. 004]|uniref:hypothetical protein n=1 Tax=Nocardia sp. 004 TaxID=3385978 RepID=UPI0039A1C89C